MKEQLEYLEDKLDNAQIEVEKFQRSDLENYHNQLNLRARSNDVHHLETIINFIKEITSKVDLVTTGQKIAHKNPIPPEPPRPRKVTTEG